MPRESGEYTVRRLARLAGVSVRTLHHYDRIGLLAPEARSAAGYRLYGPAQLLRLQQILFYRELEVPLPEIARLLADPDFDPARALREHRGKLEERMGRLRGLLRTLDRTLAQYEGGDMLKDEELYRGFAPERVAAIRREARELYGEAAVEASERKAKAMSRERWAEVGAEAEAVNRDLAALFGRGADPGAPEAQAAVARHHAWLRNFWEPVAESYRGLGRTYAGHPEFRAYYERYAPGLADWLNGAMDRYAETLPGGSGRG